MKYFIYGVIGIVAAALVAGFFLVGSPADQRLRQLDERRVNDLSSIQNQIIYDYWTTKGRLPDNLSQLNDVISGFTVPVDPQTVAAYGYVVKTKTDFELCADFALPNDKTTNLGPRSVPVPVPAPGYYGLDQNWIHPAGHFCFDRPFDPTKYPPKTPVGK